jgi:hypothetical protein
LPRVGALLSYALDKPKTKLILTKSKSFGTAPTGIVVPACRSEVVMQSSSHQSPSNRQTIQAAKPTAQNTKPTTLPSAGTRTVTEHKSFSKPDDIREFPNGRAEIVKIGGGDVGRLVLSPGWRWSRDVKPIAQTASCEAPHFQYHISGTLAIRMDDGTEFLAGPGDITSLPSGHDAWVVGDDPVVVVDFHGATDYAKKS